MDPKTLVTVVGDLPHAVKGQQLRFVGDWMLHPKHSWQLKATAYEEVVPQSRQAVAAYLASTIKGEGLWVIRLLCYVLGCLGLVSLGQDKVAQAAKKWVLLSQSHPHVDGAGDLPMLVCLLSHVTLPKRLSLLLCLQVWVMPKPQGW